MSSVAILFIVLCLCLILGVPVAISIGASSIAYILSCDLNIFILAQRMFAGLDNMVLIALPGFILAGELMDTGGLARRLVRFCEMLVTKIAGGLSIVTILTSMVFGAISGSNVATTAAVGGIMVPEMIKRNYDKAYAGAVAATGGILGAIIPPSLGMVVYGSSTGVSITSLFLAGIPTGIFLGLMVMILCFIFGKKYGYTGSNRKYTRQEVLAISKDAILSFGAPFIILGGIFSGMFTPTEAAIISILYAIVIGMFVYKELTPKKLIETLLRGSITAACILFIIAYAMLFGWIIAAEQIPQLLIDGIFQITTNPIIILFLIQLFLLLCGMFLESGAIIIITAPILAPIADMLGLNPVHFATIYLVNIGLGTLTPPFGVCLFTGAMICKSSVQEVAAKLWPFIVCYFVGLMILTFVPGISLFLF